MTCPNCKSTDIIGIQGQHYCINCGQQVPDAVNQPTAPPPEIVEAIKGTPLKLSATAVAQTMPSQSTEAAPRTTKTTKRPKRSLDIKKSRKTVSNSVSPVVASTVSTVIIAPETPPQVESKPVVPATEAAAQTKADPQIIPSHPAKTAWHILAAKFWPMLFLYSVALAASELGVRLLFNANLAIWLPNFNGWRNIDSLSLGRDLTVAVAALACFTVLYLSRTYLNAKLIFSTTKQLDNRASGPKQANLAAISSLWSLVGLDIITTFWLAGLTVLEFGLLRGISLVSVSNSIIQPALLTVGNLVIIYGAIGIIVARILAQRVVVLTAKKPGAALRIGWRMFEHHSGDLMLWALQAAMVTFILMAPLSLVVRTLADGQLAATPTASTLGLVIVAGSLSYYLAAAFNLTFWTSSYHALVDRVEASQRQVLMTGRQLKPGLASLAGVLAILILVAGIIVASMYYRSQIIHLLLMRIHGRI